MTLKAVEQRPLPTAAEWTQVPHERIEFDLNGHYNPEKHPDFDYWVREG